MVKTVMIQGTMSNAGKSIIATGLCRLFTQDGYSVAPFKSQNMALNSYITEDGGEMGRAQVVQAEACGKEPTVDMNPILLKPVTDVGSQVIVHGQARGVMSATDYFATRATLIPEIMESFESLARDNDIIVIEGAGSPAEINLRTDDIVNMGMASLVNSPVLLVGDIDRGGVFAQLYGTCALLPPDEQDFIKGLVINKFRGDESLLKGGLNQLEELTGKPVMGVVPYLELDIDDEDSLSERLAPTTSVKSSSGGDIVVIRLPKLSNFTDFTALGATAGLNVRYVNSPGQFGSPDLVIIPGTRNTIADLRWMRQCGLDSMIISYATSGKPLMGICGGYQMLGETISDPEGVEGGGTVPGLGLLPMSTLFRPIKRQVRVRGTVLTPQGPLAPMAGAAIEGYEIHMGTSTLGESAALLLQLGSGTTDGCWHKNVYGTYLHGFFDTKSARHGLLSALRLPQPDSLVDYEEYKQAQYNRLADALRDHLDIDQIYHIMGVER